jgi:hypothetical protein
MSIKEGVSMLARVRSSRKFGFVAELIMLVLGINIALWAEGRFEDFQDQQSEIDYLQGLQRDLSKDVESLEQILEANIAKVDRLQDIVPQLATIGDRPPREAVETFYEASEYHFFASEDFTYMSMRESGDFRLLSSKAVKENLLRLSRLHRNIDTLQDNFIQAMDDEYIPLFMESVDLQAMELVDRSIGENLTFRNFGSYALQDTGTRILFYEETARRTRELITLIQQQLGGKG